MTGHAIGDLHGVASAGEEDVFLIKYEPAGPRAWTRLLGTSHSDYGRTIAIDGSDNVLISGYTWGDLDGAPKAGRGDIFVASYDPDGELGWVWQYGTPGDDVAYGITIDSLDQVYLTGFSTSSLSGLPHTGWRDVFVLKMNAAASGTHIWTQLFGTVEDDYGVGVGVGPDGAIFVAGITDGSLAGNTSAGGPDLFVSGLCEPE